MSLGPLCKLSHALKARLFIHSRRLEVIARHPNSANASTSSLSDEGVQ